MRLPDSFARLFRNYRFETLDDEKNRELIIKTTLALGTWEQILWLFQRYGREGVGEVFRKDYFGLRSLPAPTRSLWKLLFIPEEERQPELTGPDKWRGRRIVP